MFHLMFTVLLQIIILIFTMYRHHMIMSTTNHHRYCYQSVSITEMWFVIRS